MKRDLPLLVVFTSLFVHHLLILASSVLLHPNLHHCCKSIFLPPRSLFLPHPPFLPSPSPSPTLPSLSSQSNMVEFSLHRPATTCCHRSSFSWWMQQVIATKVAPFFSCEIWSGWKLINCCLWNTYQPVRVPQKSVTGPITRGDIRDGLSAPRSSHNRHNPTFGLQNL